MQKVGNSVGFSEKLIVEATGRAGGICMAWSNALKVEVLEFNSHIIAITIHDNQCSWSLIGFYSPPYKTKRRKAWENLYALLESLDGPRICFGDFNEMVDSIEKEGGRIGCSSAPNYLKNMLFDLGAIDLGFSSNKFTWTNKRWGPNCIRERLDRGIANISWRLAFPEATILHLGVIKFNHAPILLDTNPSNPFTSRPFRFEAAWARDSGCYRVIEEAWKENVRGPDCYVLCKKQQRLANDLRKWNKKVFGQCKWRIIDLTKQIEEIQMLKPSEKNALAEVRLQNELSEWLHRSKIMWRQKSREVWLKDGDRNSRFFHLSTLIMRRRNSTDAIKADSRDWITSKKEISKHPVCKLRELFTEEILDFPTEMENLISSIIYAEDNASLCTLPS
jgi:hypothetical protein